MRQYNSSLADWAADMVSKQWQQPVLPVPKNMEAPFMKMVRLPDFLQGPQTRDHALKIATLTYVKHKVTVCVDVVQEELWCRLSVQVYNTREDYLKLATTMAQLTLSE